MMYLHQLWLGDLNLVGETTTTGGVVFSIDALGTDLDWGNPAPIDVAVQGWLADGAAVITQGQDNRTVAMTVWVRGADAYARARGEAELALRMGKRTTLTWIPHEGDSAAPTTVFEVETAHLTHVTNHLDELQGQQFYQLSLTCRPWVRSAALSTTVAAAPPATSTTTLIDACTSATGWTGAPAAPDGSTGSYLAEVATMQYGGSSLHLYRNISVTFAAGTRNLAVTWGLAGTWPGRYQIDAYLDGTQVTKVAEVGNVTWFSVKAGTYTQIHLEIVLFDGAPAPTYVEFDVYDLSQTNAPGKIGTNRQSARTLTIGGSTRTEGSMRISSAAGTGGGGLGTVLAYTGPSNTGYSPAMRRYRTGGPTVTVDGATVSGTYETLAITPETILTIPAASLPQGTYAVMARLRRPAGAATVSFGIRSPSLGTDVLGTSAPVTTAWAVYNLGLVSLPDVALPAGSTSNVVLAVRTGGTYAPDLDELWFFNLSTGELTWVEAGTSTDVWLDTATTGTDHPAIWAASLAANATLTKTAAVAVQGSQIGSWAPGHTLVPPTSSLFLVTSSALDVAVTLDHYHRWHTHPGD